MFVHGAGGTASTWDLQRLAFPTATAVDLPGHRDTGPGRRRVEDYADWLGAAVRQKGWPRLVLVGHSMGGAIALAYALSFPHEVAGIVLVSTGARLRVAPAILNGLSTDYLGTVDLIIARCLGSRADPRLAERLREATRAVPAEVTRGDFQACDAFDAIPRLGEIRTPALVIGAGEDHMTPMPYAEYLRAHLSDARLVRIEGAGHMVHVERPREVNDAIRQFLCLLEGRRKGA
ncbi:MAG TPA: alpha/beta hydrolase [bacterium]|nr:alpha/beta hydrolase [bacterium]